jgi:hypothetical protein
MNDLEHTRKGEPEDERPRGPNLVLLYGLLVLALVVATAIAALIVHPFFQRT